MLDLQGAIPTRTPTNSKKNIQEMVDHSQMWQDGASTRRTGGGNSDSVAPITYQLNNLGREINKVIEKVQVVQIGCELCFDPHFAKESLE